MKAQWQQLNEREQLAVVIASGCLLIYLLYALLFSPLLDKVSIARKHWHEKNNTLIWLRHAQQNYSPNHQPQKVAAGNLLSLLTSVLKQASFHHFSYQLAQTSSGEIQLNFEEVPYNAFMTWLREQTSRYTLSIKNMEVTKTTVSGVVKVSITFGVT
jgi:general secretion pathway protein M